jgi:hypothetical protein
MKWKENILIIHSESLESYLLYLKSKMKAIQLNTFLFLVTLEL